MTVQVHVKQSEVAVMKDLQEILMDDDRGFSGITPEEISAARHCMEFAISSGASQARVSVSKNVLNSVQLLNGEVDKVSRNADRSLYMHLFVDGRYGTYSTNRFCAEGTEAFILKAIERTRLLAPDNCRKLPDPSRYARNAITGREPGLYDCSYEGISPEDRISAALSGAIFGKTGKDGGYGIISEECEYSDSIDDCYMTDSQGFEGRHTETSFSFWSELTIRDDKGDRYSGYWWTASPHRDRIRIRECSPAALSEAAAQIGAARREGGRFTMVVDSRCSSRLAAPLLNALNGSAIQQKNSFLEGSAGQKIFPDELTISDRPWRKGQAGARLFDTEGAATAETDTIRNGRVEMYFINTYYSGMLGIPPTVDGPSIPVIRPFISRSLAGGLEYGENDINLQTILEAAGEGILVTGFNGGNYNRATGYFSYGVEGFFFKDGKIAAPVKEMLITGDMVSLWKSVIAAGSDAREGTRWQIPTLAFGNVDFSG